MSRCRTALVGLLASLLYASVSCSQYSSNMFLNGQYQNGIQSEPERQFSVHPAGNIFLEHAIISRQAKPFEAPQYLPPKQYIQCGGGQQCVRQGQCENGYFTQQSPRIQNCDPITDVCCTYRAPPTTTSTTTTTTTTTTTQRPYATCGRDSDCVQPKECIKGEIAASDYIKKQTSNRCFAPEVCCRMPSTILTNNGYVFNVPTKPFTLPPVVETTPRPRYTTTTPRPTRPTTATPTYRTPAAPYLPPYSPPATQPPQIRQTPPAYVPPVTQPPQRQTPPAYVPPATQPPQRQTPAPVVPVTQPPQRQTPAQPRVPYQPPQERYTPRPTAATTTYRTPPAPYLPPYKPESSNTVRTVLRGDGILSEPIYETVQFTPTFAKCASALLCTRENYCNSIGVISETPIEITPFRVPLTDCQMPESGEAGKCCRDPNYVDPWPVNVAGVCAARNKNTKPRGIEDIDANFAEIPWQAMVLKESSKTLLCGGAIVGDSVVLTTASCVNGVSVPDVRVKAGEWQLGSTDEPAPFQLVGAKKIQTHPEYNPSTGANDMAIIELDRRLEFATHVKPICISDLDPSPSEKCVTTGWGKQALSIHEEGAIMHVTSTTPGARSDCGADATSVCSATKYDSCQFDAGSALACGTGSSVLLKGIYSVENACGENQKVRFSKPDVKWINTVFAEKSKPLLLKRV